ncbi:hypothetical protein B0H13DRAFT_2532109 [Mycena leptocephala]|nr:hypothetical protein B0H13DRAFT_2532109 [Mycena leptocephala]
MSDKEQGNGPMEVSDPSEEAAASKLWAVYVSEADKYDKALVESWKNDMEGMLIFTGLFSASLTSFIVESYKTLIPDPGDSTVHLLSQISQQLAAASNGSSFQVQAPTHFTPPATSLVCNALWFISLGLSLTCALITTLLEQWARDFLHRADMRSAPVIRARIFSYLYYGMKRFNMHTVVDIVPLLLHASLFFFFAGLVAFLVPVNTTITIVAATLLAILAGVYSLLTLLPIWYLDCPYHTPLSTAFWRISRSFMTIWRRDRGVVVPNISDSLPTETMVEAMSRQATHVSPARSARDYRALVWTVKSLIDDVELEPFVEALPDILWGPVFRRYAYEDHIQKLMHDSDLQLQSRIIGLLYSCDSGLLFPEASRRRQVTCYSALWAIASIQNCQNQFQALDFSQLVNTEDMDQLREPAVLHHYVSVVALTQWSTFCCVKSQLTALTQKLEANVNDGRAPNPEPVITYLRRMPANWIPDGPNSGCLWEYISMQDLPLSEQIPELVQAVANFCTRTPYIILFRYLVRSAKLETPSYRWFETQSTITLDPSTPFSLLSVVLNRSFESVVDLCGPPDNAKNAPLADYIFWRLCCFWRPDEPEAIPSAIIQYLNICNLDTAENLRWTAATAVNHWWSSFHITLNQSRGIFSSADRVMPLDVVRTAVWRLAWIERHRVRHSPALYEAVLEAVETVSDSPSPVAYSVVAMLKAMLLGAIEDYYSAPDRARVPPLRHSVLPTETAISVPPNLLDDEAPAPEDQARGRYMDFQEILRNRVIEAKIAVTLRHICETISAPLVNIHETHQLRLSDSTHRLWNSDIPQRADMLDALISSNTFEAYVKAGAPLHPGFTVDHHAWLQNPTARAQIKDTLSEYAPQASAATSLRIRAILDGIESLHGG